MNNKKNDNLEEKQPIVDEEISRIFSDLLEDALKFISPIHVLKFGNVRELITGFKKGAEFYSKGMAAIMKRSNHGECILREQTDKEIFTLLDNFAPPPPAGKAPKYYCAFTEKALCELVELAFVVKDIIDKEPDNLEDAAILYAKLKHAYENTAFMEILADSPKKNAV